MQIQIDSREKPKAIQEIVKEFDQQNIRHFTSKLYVGDYMSLDNPRLIIERKQNLTELCFNVCQGHERFRSELIRAQDAKIKLVILCENGNEIKSLEDVIWWCNPRAETRKKVDGRWKTVQTKATNGETLYKILCTLQQKYGVEFQFCDKEQTGLKILEIFRRDGKGDKGRDQSNV